jgi:bifunctional non-homologous end joining protein LigD
VFPSPRLLTSRPYSERRAALEALPLPHPARIVTRWPASETADLLAACVELGVEGVVLKRLRSIYLPGRRSTGWRKIKTPGWAAVHAQRRRPQ